MSIIFYHNEKQRELAEKSMKLEEMKRGRKINTGIISAANFTTAEGYHQKYYLQMDPEIKREFRELYPDDTDFVNSAAAAKINGYAAGYGSMDILRRIIKYFGLSVRGEKRFLKIFSK